MFIRRIFIRGNFCKEESILKILIFYSFRQPYFGYFVENRWIMWFFSSLFFFFITIQGMKMEYDPSLRNIMQMPYLRKQMVKSTIKLRKIHVSWKKICLRLDLYNNLLGIVFAAFSFIMISFLYDHCNHLVRFSCKIVI